MEKPKGYRLFHCVAMLFVASLLIANTIAVKVVMLGGFILPAGIIIFPLSYILNDCLTEVYGYEKTRSVIWWAFICLAVMAISYYVAVLLSPAPFWKEQESFQKLFGFVPRIVIASFIAFLIGSFLNSIVLSKIKIKTKGKFLWIRTIGSTIVGEGADSLIFNFIAFIGIFPLADVFTIALSGFLLKTLYEIFATPFTYFVVAKLKKIENEDKFDVGVNYNPFKTT